MTDNINEMIDKLLVLVEETIDSGEEDSLTLTYFSLSEDDADLICRHFILSYKVTLEYKSYKEYAPFEHRKMAVIKITKI